MKINLRKKLLSFALTVVLALGVFAALPPVTAYAATAGFALSQNSVNFGSAPVGYTPPPEVTIEIRHNEVADSRPIQDLSAVLTGNNVDSFDFSSTSDDVGILSPGATAGSVATASIRPIAGLAAGTYTANIRITGNTYNPSGGSYDLEVTATIPVTFTVGSGSGPNPGSRNRTTTDSYVLSYFKNIKDDEDPWYVQGNYYRGDSAVVTDRAPARNGYRFLYWTDNSVDHGRHYDAGDKTIITGNTVLYAQWEPLPKKPAPDTSEDETVDTQEEAPENFNDNPGTGR